MKSISVRASVEISGPEDEIGICGIYCCWMTVFLSIYHVDNNLHNYHNVYHLPTEYHCPSMSDNGRAPSRL